MPDNLSAMSKKAYWFKGSFIKIEFDSHGMLHLGNVDKPSYNVMVEYPSKVMQNRFGKYYCQRKFHSLEELKMVLTVEGFDEFEELKQ